MRQSNVIREGPDPSLRDSRTEKGAISQGAQVASRCWKSKEVDSAPWSLQKGTQPCQYPDFLNCGEKIYNMKFAILTIFIAQFRAIKYIHTVVQPSPLSYFKNFLSPQPETFYSLKFSIPPALSLW